MGAFLALLLLCMGAVHPGSLSRSRIWVDGSSVEQALRVQGLSLIEVLPLDANGDLFLDDAEFEAARESIGAYLLNAYDLLPNGATEPLDRQLVECSLVHMGNGRLPTGVWVEATIVGKHPGPIASLQVEERLFDESEPRHTEYATVSWKGRASTKYIFYPGQSSSFFEPSDRARKGSLRLFFELGMEHILTGYDHLLFLLALFVAVRGVRALVLMVTAFTLAHSVTLAAAALDLVSLPPRFVELAIALSIVYVAVENILGWTKRNLWLEALGFGLLHGLGFAGFLREALANEEAILLPLIGFNLGVEAGQFLAVLPCALVCMFLLRRRSSFDAEELPPPLVPAKAGRALSLPIALAGAYWFLERAGLLPWE